MIKVRIHTLSVALKRRLPALPPAAQEWSRRHLSPFTRDFWIWSASALVLTFFVALLLGKIFLAGESLSAQAILTGQRAIMDVASGEVEGNARHTLPAQALPATHTTAPAPVTPVISKEGLAPAPLEAISEQTDKGLVPIVGHDGTLPWKYYARPYKGGAKKPIVAVVLANLGLSKPLTADAIKLPHTITLSFSPYASDASTWARTAREDGFETLVNLPMQSADYLKTGLDPGPYGLLADASPNENSARLNWALSRFPGFVGTLAPENENLTSNIATMRTTLTELAGHGVLFLYLKTPDNAPLADLARTRGFYALGIDRVIDREIAPSPIDKQLEEVTQLAKTQGYAIAIAHSYPPTLDALSRWADTLGAQGVDLVPVSAVAARLLP